jgi:two-component system sensor histidine kinase KdpD
MAPPAASSSPLPRANRRLSTARRIAGLGLTVLGLPLLTAILVPLRGTLSLPSQVLLFLLVVVLVALVGGLGPAVLAAVTGFLMLNWYFTPPYGTLTIAQRDHVLALTVFVVVAVLVSAVVEFAGASAARAARSEAESQLVASLAAQAPAADVGLSAVLAKMVATFPLASVRVEERSAAGGWTEIATRAGRPDLPADGDGERLLPVPGSPDMRLALSGPPLFAEDQRLLNRFAVAAGTARSTARLAEQAADAERLAAAGSLRTALLAAVGHDLRTPLSGIKAAVSSLRQSDVAWSEEEQSELHATIEESADQLARLIANLLDLSRLEAGALRMATEPVMLDGLVAAALHSIGSPPVRWQVPEDLPAVRADPGLLERVVANLVANAVQHGSSEGEITVRAERTDLPGNPIRLLVIDRGPGVPDGERARIFAPFQRLDDRGRGEGLGLGLAVARGFTDAMGGRIEASETPGGGLTVAVDLPTA